MKHLSVFRSLVIATALSILVTAGCAGNVPATNAPAAQEPSPNQAPPASPAPAASATSTSEMSDMEDMTDATPGITPISDQALVPVSGGDLLYQDNFTDPSSGWTEDKFDNYFLGYHEPEYYHVEVTNVPQPQKTADDGGKSNAAAV